MEKYVLDSNIYITAARDNPFAEELIRFSERFLPQLYLHAVVVQELCTGAVNEQARKFVDRQMAEPFEKRGRLIVPNYRAWKRSGEIVAELAERKIITSGGIAKSFMNDVILAASCRTEGAVVVTYDARDFSRIQQVEDIGFIAPWPSK